MASRNQSRRALPAAALAVLALAHPALGQRGDPTAPNALWHGPLNLDTVVVTATRAEAPVLEVPYTAYSVGEREIQILKADRTLPEALNEIPGIYLQKTSYGQGSPFLRGFTGFRTLLLVDGIRLNNAIFREGPNQYWSTVDPLTIAELEVVMGPSSVLYGSDAIGGTVNALTRSPALVGGGTRAGGRVYYRFASADTSNVVRGEARAEQDLWIGALGGVSYKDFNDLRSGGGELPNTGYDELDGDVKVVYFPRPDLETVVAFQRVSQFDVPRTHATLFSRPFDGTTVGSDQRRDLDQFRTLGYLQLTWFPGTQWLRRAHLSLSYQLQEEEEKRTRDNGRRSSDRVDDGTYGLLLQLESPSPIGQLTYGLEYYHDEVSSAFEEFEPDGALRVRRRGSVADDASYDLLGVYAQTVFEPVTAFEVTLGGRFTYANAHASAVDVDPGVFPELGPLSADYANAVGTLRGLYRIAEPISAFAGVAQAFRAPNLSDLTRFEVNPASGEFEVPAPDLEAENFVGLEAGVKARFDTVAAFASFYYTFIDGMITRFPTGRVVDGGPEFSKANIGSGFVQGVEVGASWNFYRGFRMFGSFTWLEGQSDTIVGDRETREPLSRLQPPAGLGGLGWLSDDEWLWAEFTAFVAGEQDNLTTRDKADTQRIPPGGTSGYEIFALRTGATPFDGLDVFLSVENFTDVDYRLHGSGSNESGVNAIIGFDLRL